MEERLVPVNALLGLLLPNDVTPPALAQAGFRLVGLEIPVAVEAGKSVVIDCIILHASTSHLVVAESKSGNNVEPDQAVKYGQLTAQAVVTAAHVSLPARTTPTVETIYLCLEAHRDRVRRGLTELNLAYPIITVTDTLLRLDLGSMASPQLRDAFKDDEIALHGRPPRLIQFDQDSDVAVIRPRVLAELVAAMSNRVPHLSLANLAERATPHYALYGRTAQGRLRRKVADAARAIAAEEPSNFQFEQSGANRDGLVRILRTPEDNDARGRTQAYQAIGRPAKMRRRSQKYMVSPDQLDLLSELDVTDNEGDGATAADREEGEP